MFYIGSYAMRCECLDYPSFEADNDSNTKQGFCTWFLLVKVTKITRKKCTKPLSSALIFSSNVIGQKSAAKLVKKSIVISMLECTRSVVSNLLPKRCRKVSGFSFLYPIQKNTAMLGSKYCSGIMYAYNSDLRALCYVEPRQAAGT